MPAPDLLLRSEKGSALTTSEMDANLQAIQDAFVTLFGISFDGEGIDSIDFDGSAITHQRRSGLGLGPVHDAAGAVGRRRPA
jgi:hypothetical protein